MNTCHTMKTSLTSFNFAIPRRRALSLTRALSCLAAVGLFAASHTEAQTFELLSGFTGHGVGVVPFGQVVREPDGTTYGTCEGGGTSFVGTVWKRTPAGSLVLLHTFNNTNGAVPTGLTKGQDGNLWGTCAQGGVTVPGTTSTGGTVFRITPAGVLTTIVQFNGANGRAPGTGLIPGPDGFLYGVAQSGVWDSSTVLATVFRIGMDGSHTTLITFAQPGLGDYYGIPWGALAFDGSGNLYISAANFTTNGSVILKRTPSGVLSTAVTHSPVAFSTQTTLMTLSSDGNIYGRTDAANNLGVFFRLSPAGTYTVVSNLTARIAHSQADRFVEAADGSFYVADSQVNGGDSRGGVWKVTKAGVQSLVLSTNTIAAHGPSGITNGNDGYLYGVLRDENTVPLPASDEGGLFRLSVPVSGPEIAIEQPAGTDLADGSATVAFGNVVIGAASPARTFTILNSGTAALNVSGVAVTDANAADFAVNTTGMLPSVPSGGSTTFSVTCTPAANGARTATLQITSNDSDESTFDIVLTATGFDPSAPEILHRFNLSTNFSLGANPACQPFFDTDGTMYGTCNNGGLPPNPAGTTGLGTVWKRTSAGVVSRVGGFIGTPGGQYPVSGVLKAGDGNFYGPNIGGPGFTGTGAAYRMTPAGVISGVVNWTGVGGANPGSNPWFTIVRGPGGVIYGSCYLGGGPNGDGNVWRIAADGTYTMLHEMTGTPAAAPASNPKSLAVLSDGTLYFSARRHIFKRTTAGVLSEVLLMNATTQGDEVMGMTTHTDGNLYGLSRSDTGNVYRLFRLTPAGVFTTLQTLPTTPLGANGAANYCGYGSFVAASDGNFYVDNYLHLIRLNGTGGLTVLPRPATFSATIRGFSEGPDGYIYGVIDDDNNQDSTQGGAIFRVALQAASPDIVLEHPVGTDLTDGTASIDFGRANTGSSSAPQSFTIKNTGGGPLAVTGIVTTGGNNADFTISAPAFPLNIAAAGSTTFTVTFAPTAAGARTTTLQILSDDADEATFDITLTGNFLPPTANAGADQTVVEGSTVSLLAAGTSPHGGTLTYAWDLDANGSFNDAATAAATVPAPDGPGNLTVSVRVTDSASGLTTVDSAVIASTNAAPAVVIGGPSTVIVNAAGSISFTTSDPSAADVAAGFALSVSFGDGTSVVTRPAGTASPASISHTWTVPGTYTITATATDKDGAASATASRFVTISSTPPGELDTTFGTTGKVTTPIGTGSDNGTACAVQSDGKIVVVGSTAVAGGGDWTVVRYLPNGSLDPSFDGDGKVTTSFGSGAETAYGVAIQPDGKIVVCGQATVGGLSDTALARYNPNGSLDTTFDGDGMLTTAVTAQSDYAIRVAIQPDGKIVTVGDAFNGTSDVGVCRYLTNGTLDATFDGDGKLTMAVGPSDNDYGRGLALQPDGKIVISGLAITAGGTFDFFVLRLNANGSPDTSFDGDGKVTTAIGSGHDFGTSVMVQSDGKIVLVGQTANGAVFDVAIVRYTTSGALDPTFDGDGKLVMPFGSVSNVRWAVLQQPNGKIVAAGTHNGDFTVVRCLPNGAMDTNFSGDGILITDVAGGADALFDIALQADGKIVASGSAAVSGNDDLAVVRITGDAPEISVEQPAGTNLVDGTASIAFGTVNTGSSSAVKTFTIRNTGTDPLTVTGASVTGGNAGDFTVNTTGIAGSVAAAGSTTFSVTFSPTAVGARTTTLQILSNDADEATFDITLTGTGNVPVDGDNDGLPDAWEITHFGSVGAVLGTDDTDGDGLNNFGEYAFGLNPNSGDLSGLPQPTRTGGLLTLTVTKQPFVAYTVVASGSLAAGSFSTAGLTTVTDTAATLTVRETAAGTRRFMQIRAVPAP